MPNISQTAEEAIAVFSHRRSEPSLTGSQLSYLSHLGSLRAAADPILRSPFLSLTNLVLEPVPLFNRAADGCRPYVEVWQGGERVLSTLVDYGRLTAFTCADEAATVALNGTAVCGDVSLIVYHARQHGALSKTTMGVRICSLAFHTDSLPAGRPTHRWRLNQLDAVSGNEARFSERFRLVVNCVRSEEASSREVVWPRPEARQLLFNSEQDYEATLRLVPRSRSKFFLNNPGWGTGGEGGVVNSAAITPTEEVEAVKPVAPPRAPRHHAAPNQVSSVAAVIPDPVASPDCDLLGLDSLPPQQSTLSDRQPTMTEDLLVGLSPPAVAEAVVPPTPPAATGFDFLADLDQPATAAIACSAQERDKQWIEVFFI